jgi:hypothetical protein
VVRHLGALDAVELRDLRLGEAVGCWWLYAPRGLLEDFPAGGRALCNLGSAIEPVLVPADREPRPRLSALQIRTVFGAGEGEGLLWWDGEREEEYAIFPRSALAVLTPELVRTLWQEKL